NGHLDQGRLPLLDVHDADGHQRLTADGVLRDLARLPVADLGLGRLGQQDRRGRGLHTDGAQGFSPSTRLDKMHPSNPTAPSSGSPCHTTCPLVYTSMRAGVYESGGVASRTADQVAGSW